MGTPQAVLDRGRGSSAHRQHCAVRSPRCGCCRCNEPGHLVHGVRDSLRDGRLDHQRELRRPAAGVVPAGEGSGLGQRDPAGLPARGHDPCARTHADPGSERVGLPGRRCGLRRSHDRLRATRHHLRRARRWRDHLHGHRCSREPAGGERGASGLLPLDRADPRQPALLDHRRGQRLFRRGHGARAERIAAVRALLPRRRRHGGVNPAGRGGGGRHRHVDHLGAPGAAMGRRAHLEAGASDRRRGIRAVVLRDQPGRSGPRRALRGDRVLGRSGDQRPHHGPRARRRRAPPRRAP